MCQNKRWITYKADKPNACLHSRSQSNAPAVARTRAPAQKITAVAATVITNMKNALGCGASDRDILPLFDVPDNLVDPLTRQTKVGGDPLERLTGRTPAHNLRIPLIIRPWARLERPPLPTRNLVEGVYPVCSQLPVPLPLSDIADPSAKADFFTVNDLNVQRGDVRSPVFRCILNQSGYVQDETVCVVHELYNSGREDKSPRREQKVSLNS